MGSLGRGFFPEEQVSEPLWPKRVGGGVWIGGLFNTVFPLATQWGGVSWLAALPLFPLAAPEATLPTLLAIHLTQATRNLILPLLCQTTQPPP